MPQNASQIGIVGLAAMGSNLTLNFINNGISVSVYNRTAQVTDEFIQKNPSELITPTKTLEQFISSLAKPRKIIVLIKTGDPIDILISNITPLLEPGDILIDMGNSNFHDTNRRFQLLESSGIKYFGCGISGGEKGALEGPSLMPGGSEKEWQHLQPLFEKIAAKDFSGNPCVTYIGPASAGHYVKMVHNGIEYGIMQAIAEIYQLYRDAFNLSATQISEIFEEYNNGDLNSFLIDTTIQVLKAKDPDKPDSSLVDAIQDTAAQKGTGNWTALQALELGVAAPSIAEAVFARIISGEKTNRENISKELTNENISPVQITDERIKHIGSALYFSMLITFIQGYDLLEQASVQYDWNLNLSEISRIWEGGCIIRAKALTVFGELFKDNNSVKLDSKKVLLISLQKNEQSTRETIKIAVDSKVPTPVISSTLAFFDNLSQARGSANLIQGLRDAFGAHTFQRTDQDGIFHHDWI